MSYKRIRWNRICTSITNKISKIRSRKNDKVPLQTSGEKESEEDKDITPGIDNKPFEIILSNDWDMNKQPVEREDIFTRSNLVNYGISKDYEIFYDGLNKPYNLNIWGVRSDNQHSGRFDDRLFIWTNKFFQEYIVTVDPSDIYLLNPIHKKGTAIIKPGQYKGVWRKGLHKKDHYALVQVLPITVYRDFNKDDILDYNKPEYTHSIIKNLSDGSKVKEYINKDFKVVFKEHTGYFGINCHRASKWKILERVGLYSAGCVVHQNPFRYKDEFLPTIDKAIEYWGNRFSFTLITEKEFKKFIHGKNS